MKSKFILTLFFGLFTLALFAAPVVVDDPVDPPGCQEVIKTVKIEVQSVEGMDFVLQDNSLRTADEKLILKKQNSEATPIILYVSFKKPKVSEFQLNKKLYDRDDFNHKEHIAKLGIHNAHCLV